MEQENSINKSDQNPEISEEREKKRELKELEKETISYEEFIELSKRIADQYKNNPEYKKITYNCFPEVVNRTFKFFSNDSKEIQVLI